MAASGSTPRGPAAWTERARAGASATRWPGAARAACSAASASAGIDVATRRDSQASYQ